MKKSIRLNTGAEMPIIGLGTWEMDGPTVHKALPEALALGYRHIDTADKYYNHKDIGAVLKEGAVPREEIFITSKVWRDEFTEAQVPMAAERLLGELQLEYLDLFLLHWPNKDISIEETLTAMQKLKEKGLVKAIGVANFTIHHLEDIKKTGIEIAVNQVEFHPSLYQKELHEYCIANNIALTAYSPMGRGQDLTLPIIADIAGKYSKSPSQIVLNWITRKDIPALPKASTHAHLADNLASIDWEMSEKDSAIIDALGMHNRIVVPDFNEFDY
jgi:2,5-diketo-D-gluconate reductase B